MTAWVYLGLAIVFEVSGTFLLKLSNGFENWHWGSLSILCYSTCFWFLAPAMKALPVGVVYAIWAGIGILAASLLGLAVFGERLGPLQYFFIIMILIAAVGLNLTTNHDLKS